MGSNITVQKTIEAYIYTVRNVRKLKKLLSYKSNVKFNDIYDLFE